VSDPAAAQPRPLAAAEKGGMPPVGLTAIIQANALQLPLPDACVDAIVTDPPYG
jgi:hypothetical protein